MKMPGLDRKPCEDRCGSFGLRMSGSVNKEHATEESYCGNPGDNHVPGSQSRERGYGDYDHRPRGKGYIAKEFWERKSVKSGELILGGANLPSKALACSIH